LPSLLAAGFVVSDGFESLLPDESLDDSPEEPDDSPPSFFGAGPPFLP
jgi:hypothetical protein